MIDANCQKVSAKARFDSDFRVRATVRLIRQRLAAVPFLPARPLAVHQTLVPLAARSCPTPLAIGRFSTNRLKFRPRLGFSFGT